MCKLLKDVLDKYHERKMAKINLICKHELKIINEEKHNVTQWGRPSGSYTVYTLQCTKCGELSSKRIDATIVDI